MDRDLSSDENKLM